MKSDKRVSLRWSGKGLVFHGGAPGGPAVTLDGKGTDGPSPMDTLLLALAGCMAVDVRMILEKGRVDLADLEVQVQGVRAPEPPRRYTSIRILFRTAGVKAADEPKLERAIRLSEETYCSVFHTLRSDLEIETDFERV